MAETDSSNFYAAAIREQMAGRSEILGSQLGALIRKLAPSIDIKGEYQNLRNFVSMHLPDLLKNVGKRGGDDIYAVIDSPGYKLLDGESFLLWSAFSNPNRHGQILYRQEDSALLFSDTDDSLHTSETCRPFQKLTIQDYRALAETLIVAKVPEAIRPEANEIVKKEGFWERLTNHLRKHGHHLAAKELEAERIRFVENAFAKHAQAVEMPENLILGWLESLQKSRQLGYPKKQRIGSVAGAAQGGSVPMISQTYDPKTQSQDLVIMRNLIKHAVEGMDLDELRSLRLPLGVILDAFRNH